VQRASFFASLFIKYFAMASKANIVPFQFILCVHGISQWQAAKPKLGIVLLLLYLDIFSQKLCKTCLLQYFAYIQVIRIDNKVYEFILCILQYAIALCKILPTLNQVFGNYCVFNMILFKPHHLIILNFLEL